MNNQLGGTYIRDVGTLKRIARTLQQNSKLQNILEEDVKTSIHYRYILIDLSTFCFKEKKISRNNCKLL